jgi:ABC-type multidrug transport system ATPase subunit
LRELKHRGLKIRNVLKLIGLDHVKHTLVGDALIRGVSGGQKKRVTLCEMLMGFHRVLMMDEISTGLDSSTT